MIHKNKIKTSSNLNLLKYELRILQTAIATKSQPNFYQWLMLNIEVDNCSASRTALIGDKCYSAFKEKVSWHTAKANCEALGLTLASIDNQAENNMLHLITEPIGVDKCSNIWTGLKSSLTVNGRTEGTWSWIVDPDSPIPVVEGTSFEYWESNQQDGGGDVPICGGTYPYTTNSQWFDHSCAYLACYACMDHASPHVVPPRKYTGKKE